MASYIEQLMQLFNPQWQTQYKQSDPNLSKFGEQAKQVGMSIGPGVTKGTGIFKDISLIPAVSLTPSENKFFESIFNSKGDYLDLLEFAPSARWVKGKLKVDPKDVEGLDKYIDDVTRLREGEKLPPSFYTGNFSKKFVSKE